MQLRGERHGGGVAQPVGGGDGDSVTSRGPRAAEEVVDGPGAAGNDRRLALRAKDLAVRPSQRHEDGVAVHAAARRATGERRIDQRTAQGRDPVALQRRMARSGDQFAVSQGGRDLGCGPIDVQRVGARWRLAVPNEIGGACA